MENVTSETAMTLDTIQAMTDDDICRHPTHHHSFQATTVFWSHCARCQERIKMLGDGVKCVSCGFVLHRSCARTWEDPCTANRPVMDDDSIAIISPEDANVSADSVLTSWTTEDEDYEGAGGPQSPKVDQETVTYTTTPSRLDSRRVSSAVLEEEENNDEGLHASTHPFAAVSRALQENILAHFASSREQQFERMKIEENDFVDASIPPKRCLVSQTYEAARSTMQMPQRIGRASVAGGIVCGVAGLAMAGPVGAFAGYRVGQVAGTLGVVAEGSVKVGVFVASLATLKQSAQKFQENQNVLTMGEEGTSQKLILVRPNVQIDPVWDGIVKEARASAPKPSFFGSLLGSSKKEDGQRDVDIVQANEDEIPTDDKVLLLVSRILNDKSSLPGHVYRFLVDRFKKRCLEKSESPRVRRDDAHAVIKHVASTLLEVRPVFASSVAITELTAAAVESLVFGQIYDLVWYEISSESSLAEYELAQKIQQFLKADHSKASGEVPPSSSDDKRISPTALRELKSLMGAHTACDKLFHCVRFLEELSDHYSASGTTSAESLLKMSCQHLVVYFIESKIQGEIVDLHAQVAFLEEFARDEQLLRGREGYALVTLQASLHFLDMCKTIEEVSDDEIEGKENER